MKFLTLAGLVAVAAAAPAPNPELDVKIEMQGNSLVKAIITNNGKETIKAVNSGSILSKVPVQKATVSTEGMLATKYEKQNAQLIKYDLGQRLDFDGVRIYINNKDLIDEDFQDIAAGEAVEVTFDVAEVFDMSMGGNFDIQSIGSIQYARAGNTSDIASLQYASNSIKADVNGFEAASVMHSFMDMHRRKRATIKNCSGSQLNAVKASVRNTKTIATGAAKAARDGPAKKMEEYFKRADSNTRSVVAGAFDKMVNLYGSDSSGQPTIHCTDVHNYCSQATAYCTPGSAEIVFCPKWFQNYGEIEKKCRFVDQAHIAVHEATHLRQVKGTDDYGTYGYDQSRALSADKNLNHADTYAYFAHDNYAGC